MAADEEIVIEVSYDVDEAEKSIDGLSNSIIELEENNKSLRADMKKTDAELTKEGKTRSELSTQIAKNSASLKDAKKERNELLKVQKLQANSLDALKQKNKELIQQRNKVNTQTEAGRRKFKELNDQIKKNNETLKKAEQQGGNYARNVGNYSSALSGMNKALGLLGIAAISAQAVINSFFEAIKSNQATGDLFDKMIAGWNNGMDVFYKKIAQGNFDNFFSDISRAVQAGKEYAATMDDLGDRARALSISEQNLRTEIAKTETIRQDQTLTNEERIKAAERVNELQLQLLSERKTELQKTYDAEIALITKKLGFNKEELESFLKNYREEEAIREGAIKLIKAQDREEQASNKLKYAQNAYEMQLYSNAVKNAQDEIREITQKGGEELINYSNTYRKYLGTNDAELDKVVKAMTDLKQVDLDYYNQSKRNISQLTGFRKQLATEEENAAKNKATLEAKAEKERENKRAKRYALEQKELQKQLEAFREMIESYDDDDIARIEAELERESQQVEAAVEAATAKADAEIERIEKVKEAEEEAAERQKEIDKARAASFAGTMNQLTQATADYINGEEDAFAKLAKTIASSLIDNIQATLIAKNAEILIQSMSTPDSILSFGATGALRAASIIALTTAAGAAAKTALGSFGDGGQVPLMANGGSIKSGTFNGNSHSNGGIDLFTGSGKHVANVEGRENFYVVNKNASDMINSLSSINQATGGVSLSKSSKFMAKGGQADMSTSNNDNDNNITAKIVASVMKQMPTQRVMVEDISTGIDDRDAVKDVAVVS